MGLPTFENSRVMISRFLFLATFLAAAGGAHSQSASEYQVKAAYLYNFAKLAEWPPEAFSTSTSPIVFCVLGGNDDFVAILRTTLNNKSIASRALTVKALSSPADSRPCTLLFFGGSEKGRVATVTADMTRSSTLLVGENSSFLKNGGMINLLLKDGKVRFEVNSLALERAHIRFDASFLSMALADAASPRVQNLGARALHSSTPPEYPSLARQMNITGSVQLQVTVNAEGSVKDVRVLGGHPVLAQAAVEAVRSWKYRPSAVESMETVRLTFGE